MKRSLLLLALLPAMLLSCGRSGGEVAYSGRDLTGEVAIIRDKQTKAASAVVSENTKFNIYAGTTVEEINMDEPVFKGKQAGTYDLEVSNSSRSYFLYESGKDKAILAERLLPMAGGYNFRDLGGYRNKEGRYVKWGQIFRSDDMHALTSADLTYLASIPINAIVDFRASSEIEHAPDKLPSPMTRHYELSIIPGSLNTMDELAEMTIEQTDSMMVAMNEFMVTDPAVIGQYKKMFDLLQEDHNLPLSFHCSAGKDRTGLGAALILYALDVDDETIMNDYLSSNDNLKGKYDELIAQHPVLKPMFTVDRRYLQAGIDRIRADHGTMENYLAGTMGIDLHKFRERFLY